MATASPRPPVRPGLQPVPIEQAAKSENALVRLVVSRLQDPVFRDRIRDYREKHFRQSYNRVW